jgi:hypothetical protein
MVAAVVVVVVVVAVAAAAVVLVNHCIRGWVGSTDGLKGVEK